MKTRKVISAEKKFDRPVKIMWLSNDPLMPTGYAKVTREVCSRIANDPRFEVGVVGEGYVGAPKRVMNFNVLAAPMNGEITKYVQEHINRLQPDIFVALEDTFTLANFNFQSLNFGNTKFVIYTPMDGDWIPSTGHPPMRKCTRLISMADFTHYVLEKEGYPSSTIWHGVDLFLFRPPRVGEKEELRRKYNLPQDKFILFNFGRNSLRKFNHRLLDILCKIFQKTDNTVALLNIMHYNAAEMDLTDYINRHLRREYGDEIIKRLIINSKLRVDKGMPPVSDEEVAEMMRLSDMVVSASTGEGSGLIMPEGMASGKPIVHTDYSTAYEWLGDTSKGIGPRGILVPIKDKVVSSFNVEHGHVDENKFAEMTIEYIKDKKLQEEHAKNGRLFVERYANWDYIAEEWKKEFLEMMING